ncbi:TPA: hypothetical protein ACF54C_005016, partial [Serratia marcescens]
LAIYHGDVYYEAIGITRSVVEAQADRFGWESALTEITPLYSQEYVSALLAELEAKDQAHRVHAARLISERGVLRERVAELEAKLSEMTTFRDNAVKKNERRWEELLELRAKLATPVRLPGSFYPDGDIDCPLVVELDEAVEAIRAAGFTVEGGE